MKFSKLSKFSTFLTNFQPLLNPGSGRGLNTSSPGPNPRTLVDRTKAKHIIYVGICTLVGPKIGSSSSFCFVMFMPSVYFASRSTMHEFRVVFLRFEWNGIITMNDVDSFYAYHAHAR